MLCTPSLDYSANMASGESSTRNKQSNASLYSALSSVQYHTGCSFIASLGLNIGDKVLDMGCGTGELTKHIAEKVGKCGEVVGIDPDNERVSFARDSAEIPSNVSFHVGNSESRFLEDYQGYYDLHFSNQVYHWLNNEQRTHYVEVAHKCLKSGGLIAIQSVAEPDDDIDYRLFGSALGRFKMHYVNESCVRDLFLNAGFTEVDVKIIPSVICYSSYQSMVEWFIASCKTDINEVSDQKLLEDFKMKVVKKDGKVEYKYNLVQIKGRKL